MKKLDILIKDYVTRLSTDNIRYLYDLLHSRFNGDLSDVMDFLAKNPDMDKWLVTARSGQEIFEMVDYFQTFLDKEATRRDVVYA